MFSREERPPPVIARESFGKLSINSTTEAIPFLEAMLLFICHMKV